MSTHPEVTRDELLDLLERFARQRPGLEYFNYGDISSYRSELRSITRDLADVRTLLSAIRWRSSIGVAELLAALSGAFSGRLSLTTTKTGRPALDYCTGQYWPTEYRRAVCAVLATALWRHVADNLPADIERPGDEVRARLRREFGRGLASRWFN